MECRKFVSFRGLQLKWYDIQSGEITLEEPHPHWNRFKLGNSRIQAGTIEEWYFQGSNNGKGIFGTWKQIVMARKWIVSKTAFTVCKWYSIRKWNLCLSTWIQARIVTNLTNRRQKKWHSDRMQKWHSGRSEFWVKKNIKVDSSSLPLELQDFIQEI